MKRAPTLAEAVKAWQALTEEQRWEVTSVIWGRHQAKAWRAAKALLLRAASAKSRRGK